jgi:hypothetical protein
VRPLFKDLHKMDTNNDADSMAEKTNFTKLESNDTEAPHANSIFIRMKPACTNLHNKDMNKPCGFHG